MMKFAELQEKILLANQEELKHTLGYTNDDAFTKTIEHITKANNLAELLYNGHFDWLYSSRQLIEKLAELNSIDLKDEIKEADTYNAEVEMHCDSEMYLRAETNFVRTTESIFKLGLASQAKVVKIPNREDFYFKSIEEKALSHEKNEVKPTSNNNNNGIDPNAVDALKKLSDQEKGMKEPSVESSLNFVK